jgi:branched-chain amino acid transport system permease protein
MNLFVELVSTGLVSGAAYGLIGMGLALIYKSTGVVNFAQGELVMLTAYIAFSFSSALGFSFLPLMIVVIPVAMALGLALERLFIRPMLGEPVFAIIMVTIGLAVVMRGAVMLIWGPEPYNFSAGIPVYIVTILGVPFYPAQLLLVAALAFVATASWLFMHYTRLGIAMRAVASNETASLLMGISVSGVHAFAWMLSSAIAAIAGVLFAANFKLAPDLWFQGLKSFPAAILGGLDSLTGTGLAGLVIGVIANVTQGYVGKGLGEISGFILIVVVLMIRPYGLFGSREIERV